MRVHARSVARSITASLALAVVMCVTSGCASTPAPAPRPAGAALDGVRRIVVVSSGDSRFVTVQPGSKTPRALDEVMKWLPYVSLKWTLIAKAVQWGITSLADEPAPSEATHGVTPGQVVAEAFVRTLRASRPLDSIVPLNREPTGEARRHVDAIVRLTVPAWGLVGVREGNPPLVAAFADVRAQMVLPETGIVVWEHDEDVTHPERFPVEVLGRDPSLSREGLVGVLDRAGGRLANELLYAQGGGR